ncbi:glycosyltransferase family 4 protein [Allonocardiopsis opalescens]|uniref:Phosphatidylinositol alpha 1,6-mannosyltransferase n=1 Tax=Allonocardiopsis opalescens TaxID=1144618 RepID=A0A2T0PV97_9ACTN|nr:glycosyltransferase family 1 protein [Allonocardiopsis opalescens]PRX95453.1 phosphatidylinositol alpha 1,6-mannosyltransferase [Allonocardiopsis opalescens]
MATPTALPALPTAAPAHGDRPLRVAIVTESFLPQVNGVTNSVCRILDHLADNGHQAIVLAPGQGQDVYRGFPVLRLPGLPLPLYRSFQLGLPSRRLIATALRSFAPDVVHLASPVVFGHAAVAVARRLALPTVAVFQTDLVGFSRRYGLPYADRVLWPHLRQLHAAVDRTLVPSVATLRQLADQRVPRLSLWQRGVDTERFHPRERSEELRRRLAPDGRALVGYVGRLARDKRVDLLAHVAKLRGLRLVITGDGPDRRRLRALLPDAVFLGQRTGRELARVYASLDVFVHTGADETFCQAVQEALASGVPVVAPAAGGPLDLVDPERTGLLYEPDSVTQLRCAVGRLVHSPQLRARLAAATRDSVEHRTWHRVNAELVEHYRQVAGLGAPLGVTPPVVMPSRGPGAR